MDNLEEYNIGNNGKVVLFGYQQDDGSWGGHASVTIDHGSHVDNKSVYPEQKTYETKSELILALKSSVSNSVLS